MTEITTTEIDTTEIDIVRHGEHQLGDVLCGVTDPELTARGRKQLQNRIAGLKKHDISWQLCVTSPRKRCREFAESMAHETDLQCIIEDGFAEVDFGQWEGLNYHQLDRDFAGQWQRWTETNDAAPHGGENYPLFLQRVQQAWNNLVTNHRGKRIVLFAHGGVIRAVLRLVLAVDAVNSCRFSVPHACHSRIIIYHHPDKPDYAQLDMHNTF